MRQLPNAITLVRCGLALWLGVWLWGVLGGAPLTLERPGEAGALFGLFVLAAGSDFLDGWLARRLDAHTAFGRLLDPVADKLLVGLPLAVMSMKWGAALPWLVLATGVIVVRDVGVTWLRLSPRGGVRLAVTGLAKWKTALELVGVGLPLAVMAVPGLAGAASLWVWVWGVVLGVSAGLSAWTGWAYARAAMTATPRP
jgi:CDP-diacylglycerol--glycerol-3-phosphate 3-phosphatidyltransferase